MSSSPQSCHECLRLMAGHERLCSDNPLTIGGSYAYYYYYLP